MRQMGFIKAVIVATTLTISAAAIVPRVALADPPDKAGKQARAGKAGQADEAKAPKALAKGKIQAALSRTDKLLRLAEGAARKGTIEKVSLREAAIQQAAARKAFAKGNNGAALHLTLHSRKLTREVLTAGNVKVPKPHATDQAYESENANAEGADAFVTEATDEAAPAVPAEPEDDGAMDSDDDLEDEDY